MEFTKNKPYWIDSTLDWRSDLWQKYIDLCNLTGYKDWFSYIKTLMDLFNNATDKKNKLELIIIMYAVIIDSLHSISNHTEFFKAAISQLNVFNDQTNFLYNKMFSDIKYELTVKRVFETYEFIDGKFMLTV